MGNALEIAGALKRTEKGNNDHYYGGGDVAWDSMAAAMAGVPVTIRPGKTIGVITAGQVVEYIWPATGDVTGTPIKKLAPLESALDGKVDKDGSKVLSDRNFSEQLFTKLNNFVERYKGKYTSLPALQAVAGAEGDYAFLDAGPGTDAVEYIYDANDSKWVPSSNTGASSFGQLSGSPADNAALLLALNANLNRANHTGSQTASTISDFNSAVLLSLCTGVTLTDASVIVQSDTVRIALGKLQAQITGNISGLATEIQDRKDAINTKRDKVANYYATQTAAFTPVGAMSDTTIRCNFTTETPVTLPADGVFTTGQEFCLRQIGDGGIKLIPSGGVTINAPQGYITNTKYTEVWVRKEGANTYSLRYQGGDPSVQKGINLSFVSPVREYKDYFETSASIIAIILDGASALQYSLNGGTSYTTVSLPLTTPIAIPGNSFVRWRVTFTNNTTLAAAYIKLL